MAACFPERLTCELLAEPRGLNTATPRFSWVLGGGMRGSRQTAYRLTVGEVGALWDSGWVETADTQLISYAGAPLPVADLVPWSVEIRDESGQSSTAHARFFTGLPSAEDWQAEWIARYFAPPSGREPPADSIYDNPWQARPADYVRRRFSLAGGVRRALVHVSALGLYELHINGTRVGDDVMAPGWTDYHQRVPYQVHDVTALLAAGDNVIGAILGEGWYCGRVGANRRRAGQHYGGRPALICQLELILEDGTRQRIVSDGDWRIGQGPIFYSDFLVGERYDARHEIPGWASPGFDDSAWPPVEVFVPEPRAPHLDAERCPPVREIVELPAKLIATREGGTLIYDVGQNLAGYMRLDIAGPVEDGWTFTLRHGERLDDDGSLYVTNLRAAVSTDVFVAKAGHSASFKPHFTFHGFQYVELTPPPGVDPARITLTAIALHNDLPVTGEFACGDGLVDQLAANIMWSQRGNFLSVPTDCPQRDERLGWTADAQVFWRTAGYNMDVSAFLAKWMTDITDAQLPDGAFTDIAPSRTLNPYMLHAQPGAPGWGDGAVIMPWQHYLRYGDAGLLAATWPALVRWMDHISGANPDRIRRHAVYNNYGDWLSVGPESNRAVVATAYWIFIADIMAKIADVLGKRGEGEGYRALGGELRAAFGKAFVAADGTIVGDTQTAYLLALDFDVLPPEQRQAAAKHLQRRIADADGHLQTGFLGVKHLCPVLADIGAVDAAYRLLLNDTYPSWGFSIRQGATTIWERWDGWTPERGFQSPNMNSFNHYAYGSVGEWLYARVAGIDWDEAAPGYRSIRFRPLFDRRIGWCRAAYDAPTGRVASTWEMDGSEVRWRVSVPANCAGVVELPYAADRISVEGAGPDAEAITMPGFAEACRFALPSGDSAITIRLA